MPNRLINGRVSWVSLVDRAAVRSPQDPTQPRRFSLYKSENQPRNQVVLFKRDTGEDGTMTNLEKVGGNPGKARSWVTATDERFPGDTGATDDANSKGRFVGDLSEVSLEDLTRELARRSIDAGVSDESEAAEVGKSEATGIALFKSDKGQPLTRREFDLVKAAEATLTPPDGSL